MNFDKKIAIALLKLISALSPESLLVENYVTPKQWELDLDVDLFLNTTTPADLLGHLLIMSHSGLIFPQSDIDVLKNLLVQTQASGSRQIRGHELLAGLLYSELFQKHLQSYFLTVKGYSFLESDFCNQPKGQECEH